MLLDKDYVRQRLESAGDALQRLPGATPAGYRTAWPDAPLTSLEVWILQVQAESDPNVKADLAQETNRSRLHASREQVDALDDALEWLLSLERKPERRMVWMRMFRHPISERYKFSWKFIAQHYGYSVRRCRDLHDTAIDRICRRLRQAA